MFLKVTMVLMAFSLACCAGALAAGIPNLNQSSVSMPNRGNDSPALFCLPNGEGSEFFNAQVVGAGAIVDATIELILRDSDGFAIADFPREDMWLSLGEGVFSCYEGTRPDGSTDVNGVVFWSTPLRVGGSSTEVVEVFVNGLAVLGGEAPLSLAINSADMNGDGFVLIDDMGLFSTVFFGAYDYSADFYADGIINLADIGRLVQGVGSSCP